MESRKFICIKNIYIEITTNDREIKFRTHTKMKFSQFWIFFVCICAFVCHSVLFVVCFFTLWMEVLFFMENIRFSLLDFITLTLNKLSSVIIDVRQKSCVIWIATYNTSTPPQRRTVACNSISKQCKSLLHRIFRTFSAKF